MAPPSSPAMLPVKVLLLTVAAYARMAPPLMLESFSEKVLFETVAVEALKMAPP